MSEAEKVKLLDLKISILDYVRKYSGYSCIRPIEDYITYEFKDMFNI
jgi:hypothetical protein